MLHVGQLHILLLVGGRRLLQVAADHELVHEDTRNGAQERRDDGHPPPVAAGPGDRQMWSEVGGAAEGSQARAGGWGLHSREDFGAPASNGGEKAGTKVPGGIDGVARVETHGGADNQDHQAHSEGLQASGDGVVVGVNNGQHTHDEGGGANELGSGKDRVRSCSYPTLWSLLCPRLLESYHFPCSALSSSSARM